MCSSVQWAARKPLWLELSVWVRRGTPRGQDIQGLQKMTWALNFILSVTGTCWRDLSRGLMEVCTGSENVSDSLVRNRKWQNFAGRREKPAQLFHAGGSKHQQKEERGGIKDQEQIERFSVGAHHSRRHEYTYPPFHHTHASMCHSTEYKEKQKFWFFWWSFLPVGLPGGLRREENLLWAPDVQSSVGLRSNIIQAIKQGVY